MGIRRPPTSPRLGSVLRARPSGLRDFGDVRGGPKSSYRRALLAGCTCGRFGSPRGAGSPRTFVPAPRPAPRPRPPGPGVRAPRPPPPPPPRPCPRPRSAPGPPPAPAARAPAPGPSLTAAPFAFLFRTPRPPGGRAALPGICSLSTASTPVPGRATPSFKLQLPAVPARKPSLQMFRHRVLARPWEARAEQPRKCRLGCLGLNSWAPDQAGKKNHTPQESTRAGHLWRC